MAGPQRARRAPDSLAGMAVGLVLVFLVVPLVELYVLIQVGSAIGALNTIALLLLMGVAGAWLMKREGLAVVRRVQSQLRSGRMPAADVADGFLILFGGALMLTPGFLTDILGLALLFPPLRTLVRVGLARRMFVRVIGRHGGGPGGPGYLDV